MVLDQEKFQDMVRFSVLTSIDLILINDRNQVLLGYRTNAPAKGSWFVPGGRIFKDESLPQAALRIAKRELGLQSFPAPLELQGIYDHFYDDSFFASDVSTHYIVIACRCRVPGTLTVTPDQQHESLRVFDIPELLESPDVHEYTKNYFRDGPGNLFLPGPAASK